MMSPVQPRIIDKHDLNTEKLSEQLRVFKRRLLEMTMGDGADGIPRGNLIMVTSALPGEGKSFVARSLAESISTDHDYAVVLIDADFRKPHLTREFGLEGRPGFLDLMSGKAKMAEAVYPTDRRGLAILPAGTGRHDVNELLASRRTATFINDHFVANRRQIFIFDTSPILYASEPQVIAKLVGEILIVVRAGLTPKSALLQATKDLGDPKNCAIVLNDADVVPLSSRYPDFYGYGSTHAPAMQNEDLPERRPPPASVGRSSLDD